MKPTQLKDALRNIWNQKVSYLSIIVIAFLGAATFLGINYSDGALRRNGSTMYNAVNYRDLEIVSTDTFTQEDLDAIWSVEGVEDVEPVWQTAAKATAEDKRQDINIITVTERVNRPQLVEGRLPQSAEECAVEQRLAASMGWQMGDTVVAQDSKGKAAPFLKQDSFTIVGIANHPDHTSVSIPDTLYVMVQKDAFDMEELNNGFMKAEIVVGKPAGIDRFSKKYEAVVGAVSSKMEEVGAQRAALRNDDRHSEAQTKLDDAQAKLDDAHGQLEKARADLDEGWNKLNEGDKQIGENEAKLVDGQGKLIASQAQLMEGRDKLAEGEVELAKAEVQLNTAKAVLEMSRTQLNSARQALIDFWNIKEDAVESLRQELRSALGSAGSDITWASRRKADIDNRRLSAKDIYITSTFRFDLDRSLETNVRRFLDSGIIPDEDLILLYIALTGGGQ